MKIYIITDMEGISGICSDQQVQREQPAYAEGRLDYVDRGVLERRKGSVSLSKEQTMRGVFWVGLWASAIVAFLYFSLGRLARAEETAQSAILILERAPGMELAYILERLSAIYQRADRHVEAAKVLARAKEVRKAFGGGSREAKA